MEKLGRGQAYFGEKMSVQKKKQLSMKSIMLFFKDLAKKHYQKKHQANDEQRINDRNHYRDIDCSYCGRLFRKQEKEVIA